MAIGKTDSKYYKKIADFIREITDSDDEYYPDDMEPALREAFENQVPEYPVYNIPAEYVDYVDHAKTMYTGKYVDMLIADWNGNNVVVGFLMDDFEIQAYDPESTAYTAVGWVSCWHIPENGEWGISDMRTEAAVSYAMNIKFASRRLEYSGHVLWPNGYQSSTYASGAPQDFVLSAANWNGTTYSLDLSAGSYSSVSAAQLGIPPTSSMYNAMVVQRCALTMPSISTSTATIVAVTAPTVDIEISIWGLS